ncbi:MAG: phosphatidylglycerophosphatase A [Arsenophonus sp.]
MVDKKFSLNISNPWHLLATGFGSGLSPIIPGTIGSLTSIPLWLLMYFVLPVWLCWCVILLGFCFGIIICQRTSDYIKVHDHSSIVWDECIAMWVILMSISDVNWQSILIVFMFFRFFDILKPWPICWFDRKIGGGFGIMLDDILAAMLVCSLSILKYF